VAQPPRAVFRAVCRIGGGNGWYAADGLWRLRGFLDLLVGGPGLRRGRRDPENLAYGEALDFWRVTGLDRDRRLTLRAEMKLPGDALLEFTLEPLPPDTDGSPRTRLVQTALFRPKGLFGLAYWYAVQPFPSNRLLGHARRHLPHRPGAGGAGGSPRGSPYLGVLCYKR